MHVKAAFRAVENHFEQFCGFPVTASRSICPVFLHAEEARGSNPLAPTNKGLVTGPCSSPSREDLGAQPEELTNGRRAPFATTNHQAGLGETRSAMRSLFGVAKCFRELEERLIDR
jgi:hypothetical protein